MSMTGEIFEIEPFGHEIEGEKRSAALRAARGRSVAPKSWPSFRKRRTLRALSAYGGSGGYAPTGDAEPAAEPQPGSAASSEHVRWLQSTLNRAIGTALPIDGAMSAAVRDAIRDFQRKNRLPVSGYIGPDTEAALRRVDGGSEIGELEFELSPAAQLADSKLKKTQAKPIKDALICLARAGKPVRGLYRFFAPKDPQFKDNRFYTGMATDLRRRILEHLWCLSHLGISEKNYQLAFYPMLDTTPKQQIRKIEKAINEYHKSGENRDLVLNVRTELEFLELSNL
ncbi:MAG TPA: peptidoglycan-binding protein [Xanthobacteraceae bacterium]|nr:peptidoglycan-binding protein [Xanthobacteraceae bacterium]